MRTSARKEAHLPEPHINEICSTIGNVVRVAAVVDLREAVAAREAAELHPLAVVLLDPHRKPLSARENHQNRQIIEAFIQFRWQIEAIQCEQAAALEEPASQSDVEEMSSGSEA